MSFYARAGRIHVTRPDGSIAFDSNERLFQVTDIVRGSLAIPQRAATFVSNGSTWNNVNANVDNEISDIHPHADTVLGSFKVIASTNAGVANLGWFNGSGSYMHLLYSDANRGLGLSFLTFKAAAGKLVLNERTRLYAGSTLTANVTLTLRQFGFTVQYYLACGSFV